MSEPISQPRVVLTVAELDTHISAVDRKHVFNGYNTMLIHTITVLLIDLAVLLSERWCSFVISARFLFFIRKIEVWSSLSADWVSTGYMVANPACVQLNRENGIFPVPVRA